MVRTEVLSFSVDPRSLADAVNGAISKRAALADRLRQGAADSVSDKPRASQTARRFQTFLELGYLVASADGFAEAERASLAYLLESVTGGAIDHAVLDEHFQDLDHGVAMLGRDHRLAAGAAELRDDASVEEALRLVTLIALADGLLAEPEIAVIEKLGSLIGIEGDRVSELVAETGKEIEEALR